MMRQRYLGIRTLSGEPYNPTRIRRGYLEPQILSARSLRSMLNNPASSSKNNTRAMRYDDAIATVASGGDVNTGCELNTTAAPAVALQVPIESHETEVQRQVEPDHMVRRLWVCTYKQHRRYANSTDHVKTNIAPKAVPPPCNSTFRLCPVHCFVASVLQHLFASGI
jgi:hypothetical protein